MHNPAQRFLDNLQKWRAITATDFSVKVWSWVFSIIGSAFFTFILNEYCIEPYFKANQEALLTGLILLIIGIAIFFSFYIPFLWIRAAFVELKQLRKQYEDLKSSYDKLMDENTELRTNSCLLKSSYVRSDKRMPNSNKVLTLRCKSLPRLYGVVAICSKDGNPANIYQADLIGVVVNIFGDFADIVLLGDVPKAIKLKNQGTYVICQSPTVFELLDVAPLLKSHEELINNIFNFQKKIRSDSVDGQ